MRISSTQLRNRILREVRSLNESDDESGNITDLLAVLKDTTSLASKLKQDIDPDYAQDVISDIKKNIKSLSSLIGRYSRSLGTSW